MKHTRSGGQTPPGPENWFTGDVLIDFVRNPDEQSSIGCAHVPFTPGDRPHRGCRSSAERNRGGVAAGGRA
jgi:hypothetical protein